MRAPRRRETRRERSARARRARRRRPVRDQIALGTEVGAELGGECGEVERDVRPGGRSRGGKAEDEDRPDRMPCVDEREVGLARRERASREVGQLAERAGPPPRAAGTLRGGSVNSIGTSTSWVGKTQRLLTSKRTRDTDGVDDDGQDRRRRREVPDGRQEQRAGDRRPEERSGEARPRSGRRRPRVCRARACAHARRARQGRTGTAAGVSTLATPPR